MDVVQENKLSKTYLFSALKRYIKNLSIQNIFTVFLFSQPTNTGIGQTCTDPRGKQGTCNFIFEPQCSNVLRAKCQNFCKMQSEHLVDLKNLIIHYAVHQCLQPRFETTRLVSSRAHFCSFSLANYFSRLTRLRPALFPSPRPMLEPTFSLDKFKSLV